MSHPLYHAQSSAKRFGGIADDYQALHDWFDATKECFADFRHRALRHHSHGIFEAERLFGTAILNSGGRAIPVRLLGEQHVREDCAGRIPTVGDWLGQLIPQAWMNRGYENAVRRDVLKMEVL
jgi:hypothetical protein